MKPLNRIVALLLVPCLVAEPMLGQLRAQNSGLRIISEFRVLSPESVVFVSQALELRDNVFPQKPTEAQAAATYRKAERAASNIKGEAQDSAPVPKDWVTTMQEAVRTLAEKQNIHIGEDLPYAFAQAEAVISESLANPTLAHRHNFWRREQIHLQLTAELLWGIAQGAEGPVRWIGGFGPNPGDSAYRHDAHYVDVEFMSSKGLAKATFQFRNLKEAPLVYIDMKLIGRRVPGFHQIRIGPDLPADLKHRWAHLQIGRDKFGVPAWTPAINLYPSMTPSMPLALKQASVLYGELQKLQELLDGLPRPDGTPMEPSYPVIAKPVPVIDKPWPPERKLTSTEMNELLGKIGRAAKKSGVDSKIFKQIGSAQWLGLLQTAGLTADAVSSALKGKRLTTKQAESATQGTLEFRLADLTRTAVKPEPTKPAAPHVPTAYLLFDIPGKHDFRAWRSRFAEMRRQSPHPVILLQWPGPLSSDVHGMADALGISWRDFLHSPAYRLQLEGFFKEHLRQNRVANLQRNNIPFHLIPMKRDENRRNNAGYAWVQGEIRLMAIENRVPVIMEDPDLEAWRPHVESFLNENEAQIFFAQGNPVEHLKRRLVLADQRREGFRRRADPLAAQIAAKVAEGPVGHDVFVVVTPLMSGIEERLKSRGMNVVRMGPTIPDSYEDYLLAQPQDPRETRDDYELRILRSQLSRTLETVINDSPDPADPYRRLRMLTNLCDRADIEGLIARLAGLQNPDLGFEFMRSLLAVGLRGAIRDLPPNRATALGRTIAERLDDSALNRFGHFFTSFDLPKDDAKLPVLIFQWLVQDQDTAGQSWLTEEERTHFPEIAAEDDDASPPAGIAFISNAATRYRQVYAALFALQKEEGQKRLKARMSRELRSIVAKEAPKEEQERYFSPIFSEFADVAAETLVGYTYEQLEQAARAARASSKARFIKDHSHLVLVNGQWKVITDQNHDTLLPPLMQLHDDIVDGMLKAFYDALHPLHPALEVSVEAAMKIADAAGIRIHAKHNKTYYLSSQIPVAMAGAEGTGQGGLDGKIRGIPDQHNQNFEEAASMIREHLYGSKAKVSRLGICLAPIPDPGNPRGQPAAATPAKTRDMAYSDLGPAARNSKEASRTIEYHDPAMGWENILAALQHHYGNLPEGYTLSVWVREIPAPGTDSGMEPVIFVALDSNKDLRLKTRLAVLDRSRSLPIFVPHSHLDRLADHLKALSARGDSAGGVLARAALDRAAAIIRELASAAAWRPLTVTEVSVIRDAIQAAGQQDAPLQELLTDPLFRLNGRPIQAILTPAGELYLPTGLPGFYFYRSPEGPLGDELDILEIDQLPAGTSFLVGHAHFYSQNPYDPNELPALPGDLPAIHSGMELQDALTRQLLNLYPDPDLDPAKFADPEEKNQVKSRVVSIAEQMLDSLDIRPWDKTLVLSPGLVLPLALRGAVMVFVHPDHETIEAVRKEYLANESLIAQAGGYVYFVEGNFSDIAVQGFLKQVGPFTHLLLPGGFRPNAQELAQCKSKDGGSLYLGPFSEEPDWLDYMGELRHLGFQWSPDYKQVHTPGSAHYDSRVYLLAARGDPTPHQWHRARQERPTRRPDLPGYPPWRMRASLGEAAAALGASIRFILHMPRFAASALLGMRVLMAAPVATPARRGVEQASGSAMDTGTLGFLHWWHWALLYLAWVAFRYWYTGRRPSPPKDTGRMSHSSQENYAPPMPQSKELPEFSQLDSVIARAAKSGFFSPIELPLEALANRVANEKEENKFRLHLQWSRLKNGSLFAQILRENPYWKARYRDLLESIFGEPLEALLNRTGKTDRRSA